MSDATFYLDLDNKLDTLKYDPRLINRQLIQKLHLRRAELKDRMEILLRMKAGLRNKTDEDARELEEALNRLLGLLESSIKNITRKMIVELNATSSIHYFEAQKYYNQQNQQ